MKKTKDVYGYILIGMIASLPMTMLIAYFTYTEKYAVPLMLFIMTFCLFKIRKEL